MVHTPLLHNPLLVSLEEDFNLLVSDSRRMFTIKSLYNLVVNNLVDVGDWSLVWSLKVPSMVNNFMWRMIRD